jgi:hypothetical protein
MPFAVSLRHVLIFGIFQFEVSKTAETDVFKTPIVDVYIKKLDENVARISLFKMIKVIFSYKAGQHKLLHRFVIDKCTI